jgi:uncharacterized protein (TIGR02996 family)
MISSDELLARVVADPADLEARRVYADALLERGDPRGELIQLQLARPSLCGDEAWDVDERIHDLLRRHQAGWRRPLDAYGSTRFGLSGGFVERLQLEAADLAAHGEAIARLTPLRGVELYQNTSAAVRALLAQPILAQLEELTLLGADPEAPVHELIARMPRLCRLGMPASGAREVIARAPALRALELDSDSWLDPELLDAPQLARLESFVADAPVGLYFLEALAAAPFASTLRELRLRDADIGMLGSTLDAASWPALRTLELLQCSFDGSDATSILASPRLESLTLSFLEGEVPWASFPPLAELRLESVRVGARGARALAEAAGGQLAGLHTLALESCSLDDEAAAALAPVRFPALRALNLDNNLFSARGMAMLANGRILEKVRALSLMHDRIEDEGAAALAASPALAELRSLHLWNNSMSARGIETLLGSPHLARLTDLADEVSPRDLGLAPLRLFLRGALPALREFHLRDVPDALSAELARSERAAQLRVVRFVRAEEGEGLARLREILGERLVTE